MTEKSAETLANSETNIESKYDDNIFRSEQNEALKTALQADATIAIAVDFELDIDAQVSAVPTTDMIFAAAARGLLEGVVTVVQLTMASFLGHDGDLRFPRDLEPLIHKGDCNGATLGTKSKEKPSRHLGYGHLRSPSRASSRAASRFGGSTTASMALKHSVALAMKLAKLSAFPSVNATTSTSGNNRIDWAVEEDYSARPPSSLASPITSRFSTDFNEMQGRQEILTELDFRETWKRIQGEVRRKGGLELKLRSLADPTIPLEKEERLAAATRANSRRSLFWPPTRDTTVTTREILSPNSSLHPERSHHKLESSVPLTTTLPIPENLAFRQEDYDGLQSDVALLETNGELLVGENCFLVTKKQRNELLEDLFQQSTINPRIQLPLASQEEESEATLALHGSRQPGVKDERLPSRQSPERRAVSRNSPGRRKPTVVSQDAVFEGQQGSFAAFPKLESDPSKTPLAKGVTVKVDEANGTRKQPIHDERPNLSMSTDPFASAAKKHNAMYKDRPSRRALPNDFMGVSSKFGDAPDDRYQLYSLKENGPTSLPKVKCLREFPSPPQGHIQVIHPGKAKDPTGSASPRSFPFTMLPAVLQAKR
ncbi:hypothetical protein FI667_g671, partial [Globisporangium splendens]